MTAVLQVTKLSKSYGRIKAVEELSLMVPRGSVYGLLGPNGSGKTTTLGIVLGIVLADRGGYEWFGGVRPATARRSVGSLIDRPGFYPWLSGAENLRITAMIRGHALGSISRCLEIAGLGARAQDRFGGYSFGMKQRLAIAAALVGDPEVLVLDEPTNGLDAPGIADMRNVITSVAATGKTVILASHVLDEVEKVCSHVAVLKNGQIIADGPIADVTGGGGGVELAADDVERLHAALQECPLVTGVSRQGGFCRARLVGSHTPTDLNGFLFSRQVVLSHLSQQKGRLEGRFLELLKGS